jgi:hypothetical protein
MIYPTTVLIHYQPTLPRVSRACAVGREFTSGADLTPFDAECYLSPIICIHRTSPLKTRRLNAKLTRERDFMT